jgi:hypothetical protein
MNKGTRGRLVAPVDSHADSSIGTIGRVVIRWGPYGCPNPNTSTLFYNLLCHVEDDPSCSTTAEEERTSAKYANAPADDARAVAKTRRTDTAAERNKSADEEAVGLEVPCC